MDETDRDARLPLRRRALLRAAVGQRLVEIDRLTATSVARFVAVGGTAEGFFAGVSGKVQLSFSGGLAHSFSVWPRRLSVLVDGSPLPDGPYADRHRLSETTAAPPWLRESLGRGVTDVRVHLSSDPRWPPAGQSAVSYLLDDRAELFYGIYLHGRLDGDEFFRPADVQPSAIVRTLSVLDEEGWPVST